MENEEKSDREGYLDFKLRVEQGDLALRLRAGQDWHNNPDNPQAPLAQYFDLFSAERHLDLMYHDRDRLDRLAREAENQLVKSATIRAGKRQPSMSPAALNTGRLRDSAIAATSSKFTSGMSGRAPRNGRQRTPARRKASHGLRRRRKP